MSRSASKTGRMRACSSLAGISSKPGREDSPPISMIAAPARCRRFAWRIAASVSRYLPPSENESGVTFNTPMMTARGPSVTERPWASSHSKCRNGSKAMVPPCFGLPASLFPDR